MSKSIRFLALLMCLFVLTGAAAFAGEKQRISYISWDVNQEPGMKAIAERFNELNPDVEAVVEVTPGDQYWTKLEAAAGAGTMPDLYWQHPNSFYQYCKGGKMADITDLVAQSTVVDLTKFPQDLVEMYTYEDRLYAIPKDYDTIALWYNKTMFDAKGIAYPDETWDWERLREVAKLLTDEEAGVYGYAAYVDLQQVLYNFMYQNGGYPISDDKTVSGYDLPESIAAGEYLSQFALVDKSSPTPEQFANTGAVQMFESGKVAMAYFGSWMTSEFYANEYTRANCDLAVLPQGAQRASVYNGLGNTISTDTKYFDASWRFLEFLSTQEANQIQSDYGSAIPAYEGMTEGWVHHFEGFNVKAYPEMLAYAIPFRANWEGNAVFRNKEANLITPAFTGERPVADVFTEVAQDMNDTING